jgi:hypothetical protein
VIVRSPIKGVAKWSKALDSGSSLAGVRGFNSRPPHLFAYGEPLSCRGPSSYLKDILSPEI